MSLSKSLQDIASQLSLNNLSAARILCKAALEIFPQSGELIRLLAIIEYRSHNLPAALGAIQRSVALNPADTASFNIQGVILAALERYAEALNVFRAIAVRQPGNVAALVNAGNALLDLKRAPDALIEFDRAATLAPGHPEIAFHRSRAFETLGMPREALSSLSDAISARPRFVIARLARAELLRKMERPGEAMQDFDAVLALDPNQVLALQNSATLLHMLGRFESASERHERALTLLRSEPGRREAFDYSLAMTVSCRRAACLWNGLEELQRELIDRSRAGSAAMKPFLALMISDDPDLQARCARQWARSHNLVRSTSSRAHTTQSRARLRIGYLCADFGDHPTSRLVAGLFALHERSQFEIFGYSVGASDGSALRARIVSTMEHFADVAQLGDDALAARISADGIDILIDLNGWTDAARNGVLALKPAPLIAHYLGFPGPLGNPAFDYLLADAVVIRPGEEALYDCAIARLPDCYQINDRLRDPPANDVPARATCGLPPDKFVFCGFCQSVKLSGAVFDVWMRILTRVPDSVLWLLEHNALVPQSLSAEAKRRGIDASRLIFAPRVGEREHMARHTHADLLLDTWPCSAHTSASDALWVGVPVVTSPGRTFASRVAASILRAIGLKELIVDSLQAYEDLAVSLAQSPAEFQRLQHTLKQNRASHPLFDTARSCRALERAYAQMWSVHAAGLPPASFNIGGSNSDPQS